MSASTAFHSNSRKVCGYVPYRNLEDPIVLLGWNVFHIKYGQWCNGYVGRLGLRSCSATFLLLSLFLNDCDCKVEQNEEMSSGKMLVWLEGVLGKKST